MWKLNPSITRSRTFCTFHRQALVSIRRLSMRFFYSPVVMQGCQMTHFWPWFFQISFPHLESKVQQKDIPVCILSNPMQMHARSPPSLCSQPSLLVTSFDSTSCLTNQPTDREAMAARPPDQPPHAASAKDLQRTNPCHGTQMTSYSRFSSWLFHFLIQQPD